MKLYNTLHILCIICAGIVLVIGLMFADESGRTEKRYRLFFLFGIFAVSFFISAKILEHQLF